MVIFSLKITEALEDTNSAKFQYKCIFTCSLKFQCQSLSRSVVFDTFVTSWTVVHEAPLSMEFSRQEYWSRQPFLSPRDLPYPGIKPWPSAWQANSLPSEPPGNFSLNKSQNICFYLSFTSDNPCSYQVILSSCLFQNKMQEKEIIKRFVFKYFFLPPEGSQPKSQVKRAFKKFFGKSFGGNHQVLQERKRIFSFYPSKFSARSL